MHLSLFIVFIFTQSLYAFQTPTLIEKADSLLQSGQTSEAFDLYRNIWDGCFNQQSGPESDQGACAIAGAELSSHYSLWQSLLISKKSKEIWNKINLEGKSQEERYFLEARFYSSWYFSQRHHFKKALVALTFLERLNPDFPGLSDRKAFLLNRMGKGSEFLARKNNLFQPLIGASPSLGFGIGFRYLDEAFFQTDRKITLKLLAGTRGVFRLGFAFQDREVIAPYGLEMGMGVEEGVQDYFGLGSESPSIGTTVNLSRWAPHFLFLKNFEKIRLSVGVKSVLAKVNGGTLPLSYNGYTGILGKFYYSTKNFQIFPTRGFSASSNIFISVTPTFFQSLDLGGSYSFSLFEGHFISFKASTGNIWGDAPLSSFYRLSNEDNQVVGLREFRFWGKSFGLLEAEYRWEFLDRASLGFSTAVFSVGSDTRTWWDSLLRLSHSFHVTFIPSIQRDWASRIELGVIGGEWTLQSRWIYSVL